MKGANPAHQIERVRRPRLYLHDSLVRCYFNLLVTDSCLFRPPDGDLSGAERVARKRGRCKAPTASRCVFDDMLVRKINGGANARGA
jgi:hypothetical protein